ncbi:baseplate assembly protein [Swaminathania salitolerans]|uniref:Baseplate assembly protein n=2 Tax=Swaminathania salitolerans TaxID=182838 RepID=A0A511BMJ3_9PROT|nr:baseplate assembly protein [Swaminathania salitolerans]GBQ09710.1 phage-related baseplate assembly protein [Swaminathania salitolerans LMG 21291]GEL00874.1 hypothetical protein SSA02_00370 [Swaminathania salitolerans]
MEDVMRMAASQARVAHAVHGIVSAVDPDNHAVKVRIQPDDVETGWIPDAGLTQVGDLRISCPCTPDTHVLLMPVEGDGETFVIVAVLYDVVASPPVSPVSGRVAQPGELLVRTGCDVAAREERDGGHGGWLHLSREGLAFGAGEARCSIGSSRIAWHVGNVTMTLDSAGLAVSGGDVRTDRNALGEHVHPYANGVTERAIG